jgi:hypothetical protein
VLADLLTSHHPSALSHSADLVWWLAVGRAMARHRRLRAALLQVGRAVWRAHSEPPWLLPSAVQSPFPRQKVRGRSEAYPSHLLTTTFLQRVALGGGSSTMTVQQSSFAAQQKPIRTPEA